MAAASSAGGGSGLQVGTVTRVVGGKPYVTLPRQAAGFEYGPLLSTAGPLLVEDRVIVGFIEGMPDQPVVVGRLGGPRPAV